MDRSITLLDTTDRSDAEERAAILARIRASEPHVPEHLRGKLFSARDLIGPALSALDAEMAAPFPKGSGRS